MRGSRRAGLSIKTKKLYERQVGHVLTVKSTLLYEWTKRKLQRTLERCIIRLALKDWRYGVALDFQRQQHQVE
jgi:hypothetical protein